MHIHMLTITLMLFLIAKSETQIFFDAIVQSGKKKKKDPILLKNK